MDRIFTLMLGIGARTAVFSVVYAVMLQVLRSFSAVALILAAVGIYALGIIADENQPTRGRAWASWLFRCYSTPTFRSIGNARG